MPTRQITRCTTCGRTAYQYGQDLYDPIGSLLLTGQIVGSQPASEIKERFAYLPHECSDQDISDYEATVTQVVAGLEQLRQDSSGPWGQADYVDALQANGVATDEMRQTIAQLSLDQECPKCGVGVSAPCENLIERKRGNVVATKNPHDQRVPDPESVPGREIAALRSRVSDTTGVLLEIQQALEGERAIEKLISIAQRRF